MNQVASGTQTGMASLNRKQKSSGELANQKMCHLATVKNWREQTTLVSAVETREGEGGCCGGDAVAKARAPCLAVSPICRGHRPQAGSLNTRRDERQDSEGRGNQETLGCKLTQPILISIFVF